MQCSRSIQPLEAKPPLKKRRASTSVEHWVNSNWIRNVEGFLRAVLYFGRFISSPKGSMSNGTNASQTWEQKKGLGSTTWITTPSPPQQAPRVKSASSPPKVGLKREICHRAATAGQTQSSRAWKIDALSSQAHKPRAAPDLIGRYVLPAGFNFKIQGNHWKKEWFTLSDMHNFHQH